MNRYEYTASILSMDYDHFSKQDTNFWVVDNRVYQNKVMLLVVKLNVIPPDADGYQRISNFAPPLVG